MQSEYPPTNHESASGLPPVTPPSGRFIAQLFLVPGLIVAVAVLVLLGFSWIAGGETQPDALLDRLESENADIRWRAANELTQRLKRDDLLASSPRVGLRLCELLRSALDRFERAEQAAGKPGAQEEREKLKEKRKDIEFLIPCLGNQTIPVGVPLLVQVAQHVKARDAKAAVLLRRKAVWTLANLGENLKRFSKLSPERRESAAAELHREADGAASQRSSWARFTLDCIEGRQKQLGVVLALAECAKSDDIFLRELAAHALAFWEDEDKDLAEKTLLALSRDDGHGDRIEIGEDD